MSKSSSHPNLEGLLDLACRNGVDIRPTLLRVLTDLYVQKPIHRAEEEAQYVELAQHLIESADPVTRATVAARLASYPGAPIPILQKLADLTGYTVTPPAAEAIRAAEPPENDLIELFFASTSDVRQMILVNLDAVAPPPHCANTTADTEACILLEAAAFARNTGGFARILQRSLSISPVLAHRIVHDTSGEPIVVAARALGMPAAMLQRVLLFINPAIGQSVQRVYELANLYNEISPQSAAAMTEIWRGTAARRRPAHQSVYYDDERGNARAATPSHATTTRRTQSLADRLRGSGR
jgi:uncharacterized protein (DUF2336 family)